MKVVLPENGIYCLNPKMSDLKAGDTFIHTLDVVNGPFLVVEEDKCLKYVNLLNSVCMGKLISDRVQLINASVVVDYKEKA